ncbi:MAG: GxxExxY protein [Parcubacteria group bacterium]|jgi:GxxExxY protein|nr:GxxExxY protein [Parcubacteria group bacterium]|tara:strand:- start:2581 stop:2964 length:384 start_codon:yes stop_codon:yes gene_type:complete
MLQKVIYPELSYQIIGTCFQVHNELGRFCKEKQYADRLEQLLRANQLRYSREIKIPFEFSEGQVGGNIADFLIANKIILECKAKKFVTKDDYHQVQRYLKATKIKLGLIVNFRTVYLSPKRVINYYL